MALPSQPTTTISLYSSITQPTTMPRASLLTRGAVSLPLPIMRQRKRIAYGKNTSRNAAGLTMTPKLAPPRCRMSMWSTRCKILLTGPA